VASLAVAAVVVSRGNAQQLNKTLAGIASQGYPLKQVVVVETTESQECLELAKGFGFGSISAETKHQGEAIEAGILAFQGSPSWLWILHQDTAPQPGALENLAKAAEISPSVAIIGPKLLDWDQPTRIRQLGLTTTKTSRPFTLVEDEYDQGQFDAAGDTLAVSTAGMLVAMGLWQKLDGINDSSPTFAQDIEFCIGARALGYRVIVEPSARVLSGGSLSSNLHPANKLLGGRAEALAKAHVHLATILWPTVLLPLLYLAMPLIALASIPLNLLQKRPARVAGQFSAWLYSWFTVGQRLIARKKVRALGSLSSLPKLYASWAQISSRRSQRFEHEPEPERKAAGYFESGAVGFSLLPVLLGFGLFPQGAIYAERLLPLGRSFDAVFSSVAANTQSYLNGVSLPSEPFNWFYALLSLAWPASPSTALAWFVFLAPALAFAGMWFLASSVTDRTWVKNVSALLFSLCAPLLLLQREAAVVELVVAVSLVWTAYFLYKASSAFNLARAWRWVGLAGLSGALLAISSPVVFGVVTLAAIGLGAVRIRRLGVLVWFLVPGAALLAPWFQYLIEIRAFEFLTVTSRSAADPLNLYQDLAWVLTLGAVGALALMGSILRLKVSMPLWVVALVLLFASSYQPVAGSQAVLIALFAVLLLLLAISLESVRLDWLRVSALSTLVVTALGSGVLFGAMQPRNFEFGIERQVPALVLAASDVNANVRTLKIEFSGQDISGELVWGDGRNQEEFSLLYDYFRPVSEVDNQIAQLTGSLIAGNPDGVSELVKALGVNFVLVSADADSKGQVKIALDSLSLLQSSGETSFGFLWSVVDKNQFAQVIEPSNPLRELQLLVIGAFALLAIPTPASISGRRVRKALS
jgi:GT2 family glycosyltransferase